MSDGRLKQPQVARYYEWLRNNDHFGMQACSYDEQSNGLLDELFLLLEQIAPISENNARSLWLRAERGTIEDYGNAEEEIAEGTFDSEQEFIDSWKSWYPDEVEWYKFSAVELKDKGYRAVMLRNHFIIVQDKRLEQSPFPIEISSFVQWLIDGVSECIDMLKAGTYNGFVRDKLSPQHRTGTICRKDYWDVWPELREEFFKDISHEAVCEFIQRASAQSGKTESEIGRMKNITADDFYRFCAMGYAENGYCGCDKTPKEQYYLHADGRDDGLSTIEPDNPEAFHSWLHDRDCRGGHPWEVCRGGNSTHVSLYVMEDDNGYYLSLAGDAWNRTIETVKFYLALTRAGVPVYLNEATVLVDRLTEREKIGIVPDGVIPAYCESWFTQEHIIDFINLPFEDREKFTPFCTWYDEPQIQLASQEGGGAP